MNKFFVKQAYVFDASLFRTGYPYKIQYDDIDIPSYELFIKIDTVTGNAIFRRYDGLQHIVRLQDYLDDKVTITGPLTITFDDCAISIDEVKPESFINVDVKVNPVLDEINGYPHTFMTVNTDSTSPYTISDGHTPLTNELEDLMRNDDNDKEEL